MAAELTGLSDATLQQTAQIWHEGWHEAHAAIAPDALARLRTQDDFVRRLKDRKSQVRLAVFGAEVLGFTILDANELYQMYVSHNARGKGVAQALMADACARMRAGGAETAWLACAIGNVRAAAFYEKVGWRNVGERTIAVETSEGPFEMTIWRFERAL